MNTHLIAQRERSPVLRMNGWPLAAQFAFRQKDGSLHYYTSNPRTNNATRINDGIDRRIVPGRNS